MDWGETFVVPAVDLLTFSIRAKTEDFWVVIYI